MNLYNFTMMCILFLSSNFGEKNIRFSTLGMVSDGSKLNVIDTYYKK